MNSTPIKNMDLDRISSPFGMRRHPISGQIAMHNGIDYPCPQGTPIYAAASGKVVVSKRQEGGRGLGEYITILHPDGTYTLYAHLKLRVAKMGNFVKSGQYIGLSGSTGDSTAPHLHFGVCRRYKAANVGLSEWMDPIPKLKEAMEVVEVVKMINTLGEVVEVESILKDGYNHPKMRDLEKLAPDLLTVEYDADRKMPRVISKK